MFGEHTAHQNSPPGAITILAFVANFVEANGLPDGTHAGV
ncbi:MAG: hypothetical protein ACI9SK_002565 [Zhongshania sp.]|jgi:hypothetical protein